MKIGSGGFSLFSQSELLSGLKGIAPGTEPGPVARRINSGLSASTAFRAFILNVPLLRKWTLVSETGKGGERRFK